LTLTTRLSLFFLATLAVVLGGFSAGLYALASNYLHHQAEERVEATLNTLTAAIDIEPEGVEWEAAERRVQLRPGGPGDQVVWLVSDDQGRVVDRSATPGLELPLETAQGLREARQASQRQDWQGGRWLFGQRWVTAPEGARPASPGDDRRGERKYRALAVTAGISLEPVQSTLRQLAGVLAGLSGGIWLIALLAGRWVCGRALLPVRRMAAAARVMDAKEFDRRLPVTANGDELQDLGVSFNTLLDRLQEAFERQRRFTGEASHQLRTPLAVILGQVEVALRRPRDAEEYQRVLTTVQAKADHLRRIVEALLFLARADADARLPERERLELRDWLPALVGTWSAHPRFADLACAADAAGPCPVLAQAALLGELLQILLDNAAKYSAASTPIAVRLRREGQEVCVEVEDHGCGIAEADLAHLFRPFFRSAEARRRGVEGVGLGLAIARRLAEAFGGKLAVRSREGQGSCFTVRLPAAQ
jgi:heavy metal sensor kinase